VLRFIRIATEYLDGASGAYDSFDRDRAYEALRPDQIWENFAQSIQRLIRLSEYAQKPAPSMGSHGRQYIELAAKRLASDPYTAAYLAGYAVLSLLRPIIGDCRPRARMPAG